jgi:hypothetical protein
MEDDEIKVFEVKDQVVPRDVLVKQGTAAVTSLAGGVLLLIMAFGARFPILGIILSIAVLVIGIGALFSKDKSDKKPGLVLAAAGAMGMIIRFGIPILKPFAGFVLGLGGLALIAMGIWKGIKFIMGLKSRQ